MIRTKLWCLLRFSVVLAALGVMAPHVDVARAQQPPAVSNEFDVKTLSALLTNMGYEPKLSGSGKSVSITFSGKYDLIINFASADSGRSLLAYIYLQKYSPVDMKKVDMAGMLVSNDTHLSYFSLAKSGDDYDSYLQTVIRISALTPATMRAVIAELTATTYGSETLWDKSKFAK